MEFGCILSSYDSRDFKLKASASAKLPEEFSLPLKMPVKNQRQVSSCVAHATSSILEYHTEPYKELSTNFIYGSPKVFCSQSGVAKEIDLETGEIVENSIFAAKRKAIYSTHGHKLYANCCGYISYINDTGLEYGHASYVNTFSQAKGSIKKDSYAINSFAMPYARSASEIMLDNVCFFDISGSLFHSTHTGSNVYAVANSPTNIEKVVSAIYATADATEVYLYVIIDKTLFRLTLNKSGTKYSYTMGSKVPVAYGINGYYSLLDDDAIIEYNGNIYFTKEGYNFWKE
jgi:hypothetical protein